MLQMFKISGHITHAYTMQTSAAAYYLGKNASITTSSADALYEIDGVGQNQIIVKGKIIGGSADLDSAITLNNGHSTVEIGKTGLIAAFTGIEMGGGGQVFENHGNIHGSDAGAWLQSDGEVQNYGKIFGQFDGIITGGLSPVKIVNHENGRIISDNVAVHIEAGSSLTSVVRNDGLISSHGWAYSSSWGDETVINHGVMKGLITMGDGNDTFDNRGGKVDHDIAGELGNDTLITDDAKVHLEEETGQGSDTVKSTVSYTLSPNVENLILLGKSDINGTGTDTGNALFGNDGDNVIKGLAGLDILNGGKGDDVLIGGADADVFIFSKNQGHDVISDFTTGQDEIDLSGQNIIDDYFDMVTNYVRTEHGNVVIYIGPDNTITLENTKVHDLQQGDFSF